MDRIPEILVGRTVVQIPEILDRTVAQILAEIVALIVVQILEGVQIRIMIQRCLLHHQSQPDQMRMVSTGRDIIKIS